MVLSAIVTKDELVAAVAALTPLRIVIDARRGRAVTFARPDIELVPRKGLRLRGEARLAWDVAGVPVPVTIQAWQLMLEPYISPSPKRASVLAFKPTVEVLDLKRVPALVEDKIADAIENTIARSHEKLAWNFGRTLSRQLPLPSRVELPNTTALALVVLGGGVEVTADRLRLTAELGLRRRDDQRSGAARAPSEDKREDTRTEGIALTAPLQAALRE
jgi:hypothetical protein